jgi:UDP-2-acetamido-3-amino-2,3-dideoxy-glucuronate N-acetyltransferase
MNQDIENSALVDPSAKIGPGTRIWHNTQIRDDVLIGSDCIIGRNVYIGSGVKVGSRCKIQNSALIYEPATLANGVFLGPGVIFTNDQYPRAVTSDGSLKSAADWEPVGVSVQEGASIGAGAVCVAPVTIGQWALVAAGSIVTQDVRDFALVAGVPARQIGWVGKSGYRLMQQGEMYVCPATGEIYQEIDKCLKEVKS